MDDKTFLETFGISRADAIASNGELSHAGVKGMKWGHRKAEKSMGNQSGEAPKGKFTSKKAPEAQNAGYSNWQREQDSKVIGKRATNRVNARMNKGEDHKTAYTKVSNRQTMTAGAVSGAVYLGIKVGPSLVRAGSALAKATLQDAAFAKQASNAAKASTTLFADTMGVTSYQTISLAMDASGRWR